MGLPQVSSPNSFLLPTLSPFPAIDPSPSTRIPSQRQLNQCLTCTASPLQVGRDSEGTVDQSVPPGGLSYKPVALKGHQHCSLRLSSVGPQPEVTFKGHVCLLLSLSLGRRTISCKPRIVTSKKSICSNKSMVRFPIYPALQEDLLGVPSPCPQLTGLLWVPRMSWLPSTSGHFCSHCGESSSCPVNTSFKSRMPPWYPRLYQIPSFSLICLMIFVYLSPPSYTVL